MKRLTALREKVEQKVSTVQEKVQVPDKSALLDKVMRTRLDLLCVCANGHRTQVKSVTERSIKYLRSPHLFNVTDRVYVLDLEFCLSVGITSSLPLARIAPDLGGEVAARRQIWRSKRPRRSCAPTTAAALRCDPIP